MNTFLPYPQFSASFEDLDYKRLGKQRVEGLQVLRILAGVTNTKGWRNHPCTKMWEGHEFFLAMYTQQACLAWIGRGYKDSILGQVGEIADKLDKLDLQKPWWLGNEDFHKSHQSNLKRKDPIHYGHYAVPDDLPYLWPTKEVGIFRITGGGK